MISIDKYMTRRVGPTENCWHIVRDVWLDATGKDIGDRTPERMTKAALIGRFDSEVPTFTKLDRPADPSIVLMRSPLRVPHVGIFVRGGILQMTGKSYSFSKPEIATIGWAEVGYYR